MLSDSLIQDALLEYGVSAPAFLCSQVRAYVHLLSRWNRRISLTTVLNPEEMVRRHFGESFFAADYVDLSVGRLADVGSGAGFPGLALKLVRPGLHVTLIESNLKRATFLGEVARELDLSDVSILRQRFGGTAAVGDFNFITWRAVGNNGQLLNQARRNLSEGGSVLLWLGASDSRKILSIESWNWRLSKLIPGSIRRYLVVGSPRKSG